MKNRRGVMSKMKVGILGAGRIAGIMADTLQRMDTAQAYAVGARDLNRAREFAGKFSMECAYGSYEDMLKDPEVELVYIATPHSFHKEQALMCLEAGKPVLCEKAFTTNAGEAREVLEAARKKNLFVTEAMWPRYMPMAGIIRDFCHSGKIGDILALSANIGAPVFHRPRLYDPNLAGGALLDMTIYPLTFASIAFGDDIEDIEASAVMSKEGVDMQDYIRISYKDGRTAAIYANTLGPTDRQGILYGTTGYAIVENVNNYEELKVYDVDRNLTERIVRPAQITGYEYEVQAAVDCIRQGKTECLQMSHKETIRMMELMDSVRRQWGMKYPWENKQE